MRTNGDEGDRRSHIPEIAKKGYRMVNYPPVAIPIVWNELIHRPHDLTIFAYLE